MLDFLILPCLLHMNLLIEATNVIVHAKSIHPRRVLSAFIEEQSCRLQVQSRYYPLVEKLLLEVTGGSRVHVFDHTLRQGKIT